MTEDTTIAAEILAELRELTRLQKDTNSVLRDIRVEITDLNRRDRQRMAAESQPESEPEPLS